MLLKIMQIFKIELILIFLKNYIFFVEEKSKVEKEISKIINNELIKSKKKNYQNI